MKVPTFSLSIPTVILIHLTLSACLFHVQSSINDSKGQTHPSVVNAPSTTPLTSQSSSSLLSPSPLPVENTIILIDVDNCLYSEKELRAKCLGTNYYTIEEQIIQNTHAFGKKYFHLSAQECDEFYHTYGSTVEGLRYIQLNSNGKDDGAFSSVSEMMHEFYEQVFENIDMTCLLPISHPQSSSSSSSIKENMEEEEDFNTGYTHQSDSQTKQKLQALRELLESSPYPIYFASNSAQKHVKRILSTMGLNHISYEGILTPDTVSDQSIEGADDDKMIFPSKHSPDVFFSPILNKYDINSHPIYLIDDSLHNVRKSSQVGIRGVHVGYNMETAAISSSISTVSSLEDALSMIFGHTDSSPSPTSPGYTFSDIEYLESKNQVDRASINSDVWNQVAQELSARVLTTIQTTASDDKKENHKELRIMDLGAGLLSILDMILMGDGNDATDNDRRKEPLLDLMLGCQEDCEGSEDSSLSSPTNMDIHYVAYEPNRKLLKKCHERLHNLGFTKDETQTTSESGSPEEFVFIKNSIHSLSNTAVRVIVYLRIVDFHDHHIYGDMVQHGDRKASQCPPHLIVGCCFADLFQPYDLMASILKLTNQHSQIGLVTDHDHLQKHDTLLYFPITFRGTTQFYPPQPFGVSEEMYARGGDGTAMNSVTRKQIGAIPSDTAAFQLYSKRLEDQHGHNLDPMKLVEAVKSSGGTLLARGSSNWEIDPDRNDYLWKTMLYFFGTCACPELLKRKFDSRGWLNRARINRPNIHAMNLDLLFELPLMKSQSNGVDQLKSTRVVEEITNNNDNNSADTCKNKKMIQEILFTAPYEVQSVTKEWDTSESSSHLGPGQIEVKSLYSLISSGTELKIFKGMFEEAALDVNIKGMADESMKYPLSYGYSLVGRVTNCSSDVSDDVIGKLVFTFSPHSSHVILDKDDVQFVPEGIDPHDAIFMPSVETALSIVHDANVRVGEKVAVYGQGLIGLLVNAILSRQQLPSSSEGGTEQYGIVTAFDTISDRLAMASEMGAVQVLLPSHAQEAGPFDVSIEVSGNARALQSAIDYTRNGGRVILGSWYGNADVSLKLGIDFHRSHKTIKTSQVSSIPAELSTLWSKERRFALTWDLVRLLRPSRLVTRQVSLQEAQTAYELLDQGKEIAISFQYN